MSDCILIASFYKFVKLPDFRELQTPLRQICAGAGLRGTILLANEGINGTIAGRIHAVDAMLQQLRADQRFADLEVKRSFHECIPFGKLKVRLKREIVALKQPDLEPAKGEYISPADWNALLQRDDITLLDARNSYEIALGGFADAIDPGTEAFHELPAFIDEKLDPAAHRRIAMYCTGGIRCEKAAALLTQRGFAEVYQLRGGILNYLEKVPKAESLWRGECFVFDERVSLDHNLAKGAATICDDCKAAVHRDADRCHACGSRNLL